MKVWRKFTAVALAFVMVLAMSVTALATPETLSGGVAKKTVSASEPLGTAVDQSVNIQKDIVAHSTTSTTTSVYRPAVGYTYTVEGVTVSNNTVTDSGGVSVPVKKGVIPGLSVAGAAAAATAATQAIGTIILDKTQTFTASTTGATNESAASISLDFSNVDFSDEGYGVYRYSITESLTVSGASYADYSMVDGTGGDVVYLDVYVNGSNRVYGYVCMSADGIVDGKTSSNQTVTKTNGFVDTLADHYYTYDLTVSKTVDGDSYGQSITFPFSIAFAVSNGMTADNFQFAENVPTVASGTATVGIGTNNVVAADATGVAQIRHNAPITYTGIPCGVNATVFETNNNVGVTYAATTYLNNTAQGNAETITSTSGTITYAAQGDSKQDYQTTKVSTATTAAQTDATSQSIGITNKLVLISPTGVTLRYAPYLAMLGAGVVALPLSIRRKREDLF